MNNTEINYQQELEKAYLSCGPKDLYFVREAQVKYALDHMDGYTNQELREHTYNLFVTQQLKVTGK